MFPWSHHLDAENDNQKSNKRNNPCLAWHVMTALGAILPWHRIYSSFPATGDALQLLETKMMPFRAKRACWEGGLCCGGSAHRNTLIPFWLNSCKFWLHALTCGQRETAFAIRAVSICRKVPTVTPWAGWRHIFLAFTSPSLEIGSFRHITPLSGSSKSIWVEI